MIYRTAKPRVKRCVQSHFSAVVLSNSDTPLIAVVEAWLKELNLVPVVVSSADELMAYCLRGRPRVVIADARTAIEAVEEGCRRLKADSYSAVVPTIVQCRSADIERSFAAGADEVITEATPPAEARSRLKAT